MSDVLVAEDPLYEELYDVRNEAKDLDNLVEGDVNPEMNALRDKAPVHKGLLRELMGLPPHYRHPSVIGRPAFTCFTFDTCDAVFRDNDTYSSAVYHHNPADPEHTLGIIEMVGAMHKGYRATMQPMFIRPRTYSWWREHCITEITEQLIDRLAQKDKAELNLELCARVPVHTVTRAIGMKGDDSLVFREALIKSAISGSTPPAERGKYYMLVEKMMMDLITERRKERGDDIISKLIDQEVKLPDGSSRPMTDREIMLNARLVMVAGGGTSWRQFGITLWALLTHRDQFEALRADRKLMDPAIEETLRWNPTDPVFSRLVTKDAELGGVHLPEGSAIEICLGAANRDPARWDNPDAYDLHRKAQYHLGFGVGPHQCLGKNVAASEISLGINMLMDRFPNLRLDPDAPTPEITGGLEQRGMSNLNVLLK